MIKIVDWKSELNNADYDKTVGIKIAKLIEGDNFATFVTEIEPGKYVNPHYHKSGNEHYHIITGTGELYLCDIAKKNKMVIHVTAGQSFTVPENTIHQLTNNGESTLLLMFSCPMAHLNNDRFLG